MRKTRLLAACLLGAALTGAGCGYLADQPAAKIASKTITVTHLSNALDTFKTTAQFHQLASQSSPDEAERRFEQGYLTNLIREAVARFEAPHYGVTAPGTEVDAHIQQIKQSYSDDKAFQAAVSQQGLTMAQLRRLVSDQVLQDALKAKITSDIRASSAQIKDFYDSHRSQFRQVHLAHISFSAQQFQQAAAVSKQINSAPASKVKELFAKAARSFSSDTATAGNGGDIGNIPYSQLDPSLRYALARTKVGRASAPVNTQQGFEVFLLLGSRMQSLRQATPQIRAQLEASAKDSEWQKWLQARYRDLDVSVNPRFGSLDATTLQVVDVQPQDFPNGARSPASSPSATPLQPLGG